MDWFSLSPSEEFLLFERKWKIYLYRVKSKIKEVKVKDYFCSLGKVDWFEGEKRAVIHGQCLVLTDEVTGGNDILTEITFHSEPY